MYFFQPSSISRKRELWIPKGKISCGSNYSSPYKFTEEMHCIQILSQNGLEGTSKIISFQPPPRHGQGHLPVEQAAQSLIQRELKLRPWLTWILIKIFYVFSIIFLVFYHDFTACSLSSAITQTATGLRPLKYYM